MCSRLVREGQEDKPWELAEQLRGFLDLGGLGIHHYLKP